METVKTADKKFTGIFQTVQANHSLQLHHAPFYFASKSSKAALVCTAFGELLYERNRGALVSEHSLSFHIYGTTCNEYQGILHPHAVSSHDLQDAVRGMMDGWLPAQLLWQPFSFLPLRRSQSDESFCTRLAYQPQDHWIWKRIQDWTTLANQYWCEVLDVYISFRFTSNGPPNEVFWIRIVDDDQDLVWTRAIPNRHPAQLCDE